MLQTSLSFYQPGLGLVLCSDSAEWAVQSEQDWPDGEKGQGEKGQLKSINWNLQSKYILSNSLSLKKKGKKKKQTQS